MRGNIRRNLKEIGCEDVDEIQNTIITILP